MNRRTSMLIGMTLLGLAIAALPRAGFAQSDPFVGTWKLNIEKSKIITGPGPLTDAVSIQAEGQSHKAIAANRSGEVTDTQIYDGMSHPVTGIPDRDARAFTRVDAYTIISSGTKAGKLVRTATDVVSQDGKTLTLTRTGMRNGQPYSHIAVYDKQ
jgi:hypothetical protein